MKNLHIFILILAVVAVFTFYRNTTRYVPPEPSVPVQKPPPSLPKETVDEIKRGFRERFVEGLKQDPDIVGISYTLLGENKDVLQIQSRFSPERQLSLMRPGLNGLRDLGFKELILLADSGESKIIKLSEASPGAS